MSLDEIRQAVKEGVQEAHREGVGQPRKKRGRSRLSLLLALGGLVAVRRLMRGESRPVGETVKEMPDQVRNVAEKTAEWTEQTTEETADSVREQGQRASEMTEEVGERAGQAMEETGSEAADRMESTGTDAADEMEEQGDTFGEQDDEE